MVKNVHTINPDVIRRAVESAVRHALEQTMGPVDDHKGQRPKDGTICAAIWDELDMMNDEHHVPKLQDIMASA
ncbi:MAG TPA: hypothetical protein VIY48_14000, partial [Candidatus Paceibacterota bacterium]